MDLNNRFIHETSWFIISFKIYSRIYSLHVCVLKEKFLDTKSSKSKGRWYNGQKKNLSNRREKHYIDKKSLKIPKG